MELKEKKYLNKLINKYQIRDSNKYLLSPNSFSNEDIICGVETLLSKKITMSALTKKFEYEFAKYVGAKYALMVNSGSSANLLATFALINPLKKNRLKKTSIKYFILHQASKYVCDKIKDKLGLAKKFFLNNYQNYGNTVSSTIPLLLEECIKKKKIKKKDIIILCGFGVGLSWGIAKIKW